MMRFTKMHGLGNDFIVIDAINQSISLSKEQIQQWSQRNTGIGFDQCLLIEKPRSKNEDFFYRIFNANGEEVGQCGNGARCLARFIQYYGLSDKTTLKVATKTTLMELMLNDDATVTVNMGIPKLNPSEIPLIADITSATYDLNLKNNQSHTFHAIGLGNPHAITVVETIANYPIELIGQEISEHPLFPEQVNAGFMQIIDKNHLRLRVYERGAGLTSACGSGAVAAAAIGKLYHQMASEIKVSLDGGELTIVWPDNNGPIYMRGSASFIYEGVLLECE
ncbi:MAG: diaminopimelate epimerase [Proteobacteria bacterium]|nr:diaminopimelate epimerase [Pseudomonadota bacterium]